MAKSKSTRAVVLFEDQVQQKNKYAVALQFVRFEYPDGTSDMSFRVMGKDDKGRMRSLRGQCGFNSLEEMESLIIRAKKAGWGKMKGTMYA